MTVQDSQACRDVRTAYEASSHALALGASRAYLRTLAEQQDAALTGDADAVRAVREARTLLALASPELVALQVADPEQRPMIARRTIS
ncbi:hypothetical protein [Streptomyces sp. DSM 118148]|uniref:hypothetical protein n=1 Tax=Streptomyces sp. DSM 118148 TaxID=3448667 RepID=UPI00403FDDD4